MKATKTKFHFTDDIIVQTYCKTNPIFKKFLEELYSTIAMYYDKNLTNLDYPTIRVDFGSKFIKITVSTSVWGFISRVNEIHKGAPIKKGDLLKPASWRGPAKHSRGNITDGTAKYDTYGPTYLR
jgi:hypothetical protein